jgi:small-conductance mechanosensitive channel
MRASPFLIALALPSLFAFAAEDAAPIQPVETRAVMTGEQVIQILDATVDWYRTLGSQQQAATQPSDLLILYANRQTADKVVALAFEIARANAELLSSEAQAQQADSDPASLQALLKLQRQLDDRRKEVQTQIDALKSKLSSSSGEPRSQTQDRIAVLQGELDLVNARRNLLTTMAQFASQADVKGSGANALKAHIDAIAASIPASNPTATSPVTTNNAPAASASATALSRFGIWDLTSTVLRLSAKANTIKTIDQRTAELQDVFAQVRNPPLEQLKRLSARGDALASEAQQSAAGQLRGVRDQYDTLAWLFAQTSSIVTPLSKAGVLLSQYRRNLDNWREITQRQYHEALKALGMRVLLFAGLIALVFVAASLWRRIVFRYIHEARRRVRFMLIQRIVVWSLVVAIAASTFATELGSLATFAGLITAGLAVAMQSVLVSLVGYFFLIGRYGIRVGDRVQIGNVTGEVIDMGLVRLHLMELAGDGLMSPTGRVVAFANSIIFQASGGLFKQIPGVNLAWHDITLTLPTGADYAVMKDELSHCVVNILKDYQEDLARQTREIQKTALTHGGDVPAPQVQLRFSASGVEALVRYQVQLDRAAEIDERVSRGLLSIVSAHAK